MTKEERDSTATYIMYHPELSYKQLGVVFSCHEMTIFNIAKEYGIKRVPGRHSKTFRIPTDLITEVR
jgi:hypothetical protein